MKVRDLINKLEKADPEQEVFAAPLIFIPILQLNADDGTLSDREVEKFPPRLNVIRLLKSD